MGKRYWFGRQQGRRQKTTRLRSERSSEKLLIGSVFKSEEALQKALEEAGLGNVPVIVLDGKPRLALPLRASPFSLARIKRLLGSRSLPNKQ